MGGHRQWNRNTRFRGDPTSRVTTTDPNNNDATSPLCRTDNPSHHRTTADTSGAGKSATAAANRASANAEAISACAASTPATNAS